MLRAFLGTQRLLLWQRTFPRQPPRPLQRLLRTLTMKWLIGTSTPCASSPCRQTNHSGHSHSPYHAHGTGRIRPQVRHPGGAQAPYAPDGQSQVAIAAGPVHCSRRHNEVRTIGHTSRRSYFKKGPIGAQEPCKHEPFTSATVTQQKQTVTGPKGATSHR